MMNNIQAVPVVVVSTQVDNGNNAITIVFPAEPWDQRGLYCTCYGPYDGHGGCSPEWVKSQRIVPKEQAEQEVAKYIAEHSLPQGMVYVLTAVWNKDWKYQREDKAKQYRYRSNNNTTTNN